MVYIIMMKNEKLSGYLKGSQMFNVSNDDISSKMDPDKWTKKCSFQRSSFRLNSKRIITPGYITWIHIICAFILVNSVCSSQSASQSYYPPFFNVAKEKPVTLQPSTAVCGELTPSKYCESTITRQNLCDELTCEIKCFGDASIGVLLNLFDSVSDSQPWSCASIDSSFVAPGTTSSSVKFNSQNNPCYLSLKKTDTLPFTLESSWSNTFAFWIWHDVATNKKSTILDMRDSSDGEVFKIRMDGSLITTVSGSEVISDQAWTIPQQQWTHVTLTQDRTWVEESGTSIITIYNSRTSVYINGSLISPTHYTANVRTQKSPRNINAYYVGDSKTGGENFVGNLQDLKMYKKSVSNREAMEIYTGSLPATRIANSCRCPAGFPALRPTDMARCIQNPGTGSTSQESYRITRNSYPIDFVNDGKVDTKWISQPPQDPSTPATMQTEVTITLGQVYEVRHVEITFYSPYPSVIIIERQMNSTSAFEYWQLYSQDCKGHLSYEPNEPIASANSVVCKYLVETNQVFPYSNGVKKFDLLSGRPGRTGDKFTPLLRDFLKAYAVKVILRGHDYVQFDKHKYHSLYEVKVNATCDCHGHGVSCDTSVSPYQCECANSSYTTGRQCDQCVANTYRLPNKDVYDPDLCLPCDCNVAGTVGGDMACNVATGQCNCKKNVGGLKCDSCLASYFNLDVNNPDGCSFCSCNVQGVSNMSRMCNDISGECLCKQNVIGNECQSCAANHYGLSSSNPEGCTPCNCDTAGVAGDISCHNTTGQCNCKTLATGLRCNTCKDGYYNLDQNSQSGCTQCGCDQSGSYNVSCHLTTGQCLCKPNVIGRTCNQCKSGYFAIDDTDFRNNGCSYGCNCSTVGTMTASLNTCVERGGQCSCKANTQGRACDTCKTLSYGIGSSVNYGCTACDCDIKGTEDIGVTCNQTDGQCGCKKYATSRRCDHCQPGYYNLKQTTPEGCVSCSCYPMGTNGSVVCDEITGQCPCNVGEGDPQAGGRQCKSYITSVVPVYGPESGGTDVTISGGYLGSMSTMQILLGQIDCPLNTQTSSPTKLWCQTTALPQGMISTVRGVGQDVTIKLSDGSILDTGMKYTYKRDPVINSINPLNSILGGGILLSVVGTNLDSIAFPYMEITMVYTPKSGSMETDMFDSLCDVKSSVQMLCPTPNITLPGSFNQNTASGRRKKRQTANVVEYQLNSETLQFYIGFRLDGVTQYRNLSTVAPQYSVLNVYINPAFEVFEGVQNLKVYRPYWPFQDNHIIVKGERLNLGATVADYSVQIGKGQCTNIDLTDNSLSCVPPSSQPEYVDGLHQDGAPAFVIKVGNINHKAGYLRYEHSFWDNTIFRWAVIGGLIGVVVIITLIVICCCCLCRNREKKAKPEKKLAHLDQFDHFDMTDKQPFEPVETKTNGAGRINNAYTPEANGNSDRITTLPLPMKPNQQHQYQQKQQQSSFMPTTMPLPPRNNDMKQQKHTRNVLGSNSSYMTPMTTPEVLEVIPPELKYRVEQQMVEFSRISLGNVITQGKIGIVYTGMFSDRYFTRQKPVMIKSIADNGRTPREIQHFLEDTEMMRQFDHPNVLPLCGIAIHDNRVFSVLPHVESGNLKQFITRDDNMLTVGDLLNLGHQVAKGMAYLSDHKLVHRDLATRNCVVDKDMKVKVADRALSHDLFPQEYWKSPDKSRPMPVRWMAPETLEIDVFSAKSDTWSFGILLWELLTRGCMPYPDIRSHSVREYLLCGNRMDRPDFSPEEIYSMMLQCWDDTPRQRPDFRELSEALSSFLFAQNSKTNMKNRSRQVPSYRKKGMQFTHLYS